MRRLLWFSQEPRRRGHCSHLPADRDSGSSERVWPAQGPRACHLSNLAGSICSLVQTPPGARGLGRQVAGRASKRLALTEGQACWGQGAWPQKGAPDHYAGYFDKNRLNTWCVLRLKQAGPAPRNVPSNRQTPREVHMCPHPGPQGHRAGMQPHFPQKRHHSPSF